MIKKSLKIKPLRKLFRIIIKILKTILIKIFTKISINRSQLYPFFKGIYKLYLLILRCLYTSSFL